MTLTCMVSCHHCRLKMGPFSVLPFSFVCILVASKGLRCREVSITIMTFKFSIIFIACGGGSGGGGDGGGGGEGVTIAEVRVVGGGGSRGGGEVNAEETDGGGVGVSQGGRGFSGGGRGGADEGELREGVYIHKIMGLI
ncbi:unnamed protein product [Amaranthus hypochondriacus]